MQFFISLKIMSTCFFFFNYHTGPMVSPAHFQILRLCYIRHSSNNVMLAGALTVTVVKEVDLLRGSFVFVLQAK